MYDNPFTKILQEGAARRQFLKGAGVGAVGLGLSLAPGRRASAAITKSVDLDVDIFNFALNFEYLGAEYYFAALGLTLPALAKATGTVTKPSPTAVPFDNAAILGFAQQLAIDEYAHVVSIREILGSAAIDEPDIDLENSWTNLAVAAGLINQGEVFNPFESETNFLLGAYVLEDVCVTALCGAASLITSKVNLSYAASILGVEGYQIGMIRQRLSAIGGGGATNAISALRAKLSAAIVPSSVPDDNGTDYNGNAFNFTNTDVNAQAFRRTPGQVLNIAFGGEGTMGGGFFPHGVGGPINSTTFVV